MSIVERLDPESLEPEPVDPEIRVLREDDPETEVLRAAGWSVVAESWGARLHVPPDGVEQDAVLEACLRAVDEAARAGWRIEQLGPQDAVRIADLDADCADDYPWTPATGHDVPDPEDLGRRLRQDWSAFGAFRRDGDPDVADGPDDADWYDSDPDAPLSAVTVVSEHPDRVETEFTATHPDARRRGLATAVKAESILSLVAEGHRVFGTGGAAVNEGSLRANLRLGYVLEPRWLSWRAPAPPAPATARGGPGSSPTAR
ncbi:GNAT family N-acetyltransferase [Cellulomonas sp. PhB150]|uniref:GNAT family N-acetyltransferase n=1 Tax=Cellulomonas sp. PhB150 TaxID=2485188 RepID=UPI000F468456|nr:hypothetical protein [Cellulomonas sp. PhB150]ROS30538.1 hypothetical protein EDF34_0176 [Cellulomonas sp. PhB150]